MAAGIRSVVPSGGVDGGLIDGEGNLQQWQRPLYIFGWCAYHTRRSLFIKSIRTKQIMSVPFTVWKLNPNSNNIWIQQIQFMVLIWVWLGEKKQHKTSIANGAFVFVKQFEKFGSWWNIWWHPKNMSLWGPTVSSAMVLVFAGIFICWGRPLRSFCWLILKQSRSVAHTGLKPRSSFIILQSAGFAGLLHHARLPLQYLWKQRDVIWGWLQHNKSGHEWCLLMRPGVGGTVRDGAHFVTVNFELSQEEKKKAFKIKCAIS